MGTRHRARALVVLLFLAGICHIQAAVDPCSTDVADFSCDSIGDELVANPEDCLTYFECVDGKLEKTPCPTRQAFNPRISECSGVGNCQKQCDNGGGIAAFFSQLTVSVDDDTKPGSDNSGWKQPDSFVDICTQVVDCREQGMNTVFPDPQNCDYFYGCVEGEILPQHFHCDLEAGAKFDAGFLQCVTPEQKPDPRCHSSCPDQEGLITPALEVTDPPPVTIVITVPPPVITVPVPPTTPLPSTTSATSTVETTAQPQTELIEMTTNVMNVVKTTTPPPLGEWKKPDFTVNVCTLRSDECGVKYEDGDTFPDPDNCNYFYQCIGANLKHFRCPENQGFHALVGCIDANGDVEVKCQTCPNGGIVFVTQVPEVATTVETTEEPTMPPTIGETTLGLVELTTLANDITTQKDLETTTTTVAPMTTVEAVAKLDACKDDLSCPSGDARWGNPADCFQYFSCSNGRISLQECPIGEEFDIISYTCVQSGNAVCQEKCSQTTPSPIETSLEDVLTSESQTTHGATTVYDIEATSKLIHSTDVYKLESTINLIQSTKDDSLATSDATTMQDEVQTEPVTTEIIVETTIKPTSSEMTTAKPVTTDSPSAEKTTENYKAEETTRQPSTTSKPKITTTEELTTFLKPETTKETKIEGTTMGSINTETTAASRPPTTEEVTTLPSSSKAPAIDSLSSEATTEQITTHFTNPQSTLSSAQPINNPTSIETTFIESSDHRTTTTPTTLHQTVTKSTNVPETTLDDILQTTMDQTSTAKSTRAPTTAVRTTIEPTTDAETTLEATQETTMAPITVPETSISQSDVPETTIIETDGLETTLEYIQETTNTQTTDAESKIASTTAPKTTIESTTIPETTIEPTTVPETTVEQTPVPETTLEAIQETTMSPTTVPKSSAAPSTVPDTTIAQTTDPETTLEAIQDSTLVSTSISLSTAPKTTIFQKIDPETTLEAIQETTIAPTTVLKTSRSPTTVPDTTIAQTTDPETTAMGNDKETTIASTTIQETTLPSASNPATTSPITTQYDTTLAHTSSITLQATDKGTTALLTTEEVHEVDPTTDSPLTSEFSSAITNALSTETRLIHSTEEEATSSSSESPTTTEYIPMDPCKIRPCQYDGELVALPGECNSYLMCRNSNLIVQKCSSDEVFDYQLLQCQPPSSNPVCLEKCYELKLTSSVAQPKEGQSVSYTCSFSAVQALSPQTLIRYEWYLNGMLISDPTIGSRISILNGKRLFNKYWDSTLTFDPISRHDAGSIRCNALYGDEDSSWIETELSVLPLPLVLIYPMTAAITEGSLINITCFADQPVRIGNGEVVDAQVEEIIWYRNGTKIIDGDDGEEITKDSSDMVETLIVVATEDVHYSCKSVNSAGESEMANALIDVIQPISTVCEDEFLDDVQWTKTSAGKINLQPCPGEAIGIGSRACTLTTDGATWEASNFNQCVDREFEIILDEVTRITEGIGADNSSNYEATAKKIVEITAEPDKLTPGNVIATTEAVSKLAKLRETRPDVEVDAEECQAVVDVLSTILSEESTETWQNIQTDMPEESVKLMKVADTYGQAIATQLAKDESGSPDDIPEDVVTIQSSNIFLQAEYVMKTDIHDVTFPKKDPLKDELDWVMESADQITFDSDTLQNIADQIPGRVFALSSVYFKTLAEFLPAASKNQSADSRILSLTLNGLKSSVKLDPPVTYRLQHEMIPDENHTAVCSFWNFKGKVDGSMFGGWSEEGCRAVGGNDTETTCECDHLTNFAVLISPVRAMGIHHTALSIISLIGCIISIIALVMTIFIYASMWKEVTDGNSSDGNGNSRTRHVKSHQAVVLLNLCVVLIIANLLFLIGIDKTENELMCKVIAVLLHYFWLVAFFMMLIEGVELVLYIIYVFHVHRKRETAMLVLIAWILPLAIVGASLGITKTEGYGNDQFCWLSLDQGLLWAFVGPALFVVFINTIIFFVVLRRICTAKIPVGGKEQTTRNKVRATMWNVIVITPILGLTWIFGVLAINEDLVWFQYVFCVLNSLQGLFICIFHGCCNKKVRERMDSKTSKSRTPSNSSMWGKKGKYAKTPSTNTKRTRLKSDQSRKTTRHSNSNGSSGIDSRKLSDISNGPPRFGSVSSAQASSMRQLSEEQEVAIDMCSEISDSPMNFDSGSSGYGSSINGFSNGSDVTYSTFISNNSASNNNNHNSNGSAFDSKKEPVTRVLSSTSC